MVKQHNENLGKVPRDSDHEIVSARILSAPQEVIWEAWTNPKYLAQWWGPNGFTNTFQEFDFRVNGIWRHVMHGPNGKDFPNEARFVEIVRPERIVLDHVSKPVFRVIAKFEPLEKKTAITYRMLFQSAKECEAVKRYAVEANEQNFDRLEVVVAKMKTA